MSLSRTAGVLTFCVSGAAAALTPLEQTMLGRLTEGVTHQENWNFGTVIKNIKANKDQDKPFLIMLCTFSFPRQKKGKFILQSYFKIEYKMTFFQQQKIKVLALSTPPIWGMSRDTCPLRTKSSPRASSSRSGAFSVQPATATSARR